MRDLNLIKRWNNLMKAFTDPSFYSTPFLKEFTIDIDNSNVFAIQLYGIDQGIDGRRIFDLVAASFASYPDKDYCVISVQTKEMRHSEILNYFSVIILRSGWKWRRFWYGITVVTSHRKGMEYRLLIIENDKRIELEY